MPFGIHGNRSFTATSVMNNAPNASGVYGLADMRGWIFIGETADIQSELLRHLQYPHPFLKEHPPSGFTYELAPTGQRLQRRDRLVFELAPAGNRLGAVLEP